MSLLWNLCIYIYIYIYIYYIVRRAVSHFQVLFCEFLHHSFKNYSPTSQREDTNHHTSSMATARTETACGHTYSITAVIWATPWQKGLICQCRCLHCHGPNSPIMATLMSMSARVPQCRHILQSTWCAKPVCM